MTWRLATKARQCTFLILVAGVASAGEGRTRGSKGADASTPAWLGENMPLPFAVKNAEDLSFKAAAERQYLMFNLLAAGKVAFDKADWATANEKWESLLRLPDVPAKVDGAVRPLLLLAREKAGMGNDPASLPPPAPPEAVATAAQSVDGVRDGARRAVLTVTGTIQGGGSAGPGGAVISLRRANGPTPKPRRGRIKAVVQRDKRFVPHVLAVPAGSTVEFRNEDELFHNVFSLSKPNNFDLGLYKGGAVKEQVFETPGVVHLLCNIHASMQGYLYVVDTPYFAQADGDGKFSIRGVPPGDYLAEVWHEASANGAKFAVKVVEGMAPVSATVDGDKRASPFVPDKSGKPRQPQLGY